MRAILFLVLLTLALPAQAAEKKGKRKPANKAPSRVVSFVCREAENEQENAFGLVHMAMGIRDSATGAFSMSLYVRGEKTYASRTLTGTFSSVPGGFIYRADWAVGASEFVLIHIHPGEKTAFPGLGNKQSCEIVGQMESS